MLNVIVLVGRVSQAPQIKITASGNKLGSLMLDVDRGFRNSNGEYEKDCFHVILWRGIAETCCECCKVGSIVTVKGRLQAHNYDSKEGQTYYNAEIIAEKVSIVPDATLIPTMELGAIQDLSSL